jgi:predicted Rossmann-fold nucleotide-binding protein
VATLVQTGKIERLSMILVGKKFWGPVVSWMEHQLLDAGLISPEDPKLLRVVDTAEEALALILKARQQQKIPKVKR